MPERAIAVEKGNQTCIMDFLGREVHQSQM